VTDDEAEHIAKLLAAKRVKQLTERHIEELLGLSDPLDSFVPLSNPLRDLYIAQLGSEAAADARLAAVPSVDCDAELQSWNEESARFATSRQGRGLTPLAQAIDQIAIEAGWNQESQKRVSRMACDAISAGSLQAYHTDIDEAPIAPGAPIAVVVGSLIRPAALAAWLRSAGVNIPVTPGTLGPGSASTAAAKRTDPVVSKRKAGLQSAREPGAPGRKSLNDFRHAKSRADEASALEMAAAHFQKQKDIGKPVVSRSALASYVSEHLPRDLPSPRDTYSKETVDGWLKAAGWTSQNGMVIRRP